MSASDGRTPRRKVVEVAPTLVPNLGDKLYATTDLYFAAFLATKGVILVQAVEGTRCSFVFNIEGQPVEDLKIAWFNGQNDEVSATKFADKVKQFKALAMRRA